MKEIAEYMQEHKQELFDENPMMITEERHEVSQVIADAPRFQSLKFFGVVAFGIKIQQNNLQLSRWK